MSKNIGNVISEWLTRKLREQSDKDKNSLSTLEQDTKKTQGIRPPWVFSMRLILQPLKQLQYNTLRHTNSKILCQDREEEHPRPATLGGKGRRGVFF